MGIGLAWHHVPMTNTTSVVWHNGGTGGYRTFAGFNPVTHAGVVVLTNSNVAEDDIGLHLVNPAAPLSPPRLPAWVRTKAITLPAATLDAYVGDYALAPTFHIVITRLGDGLGLQATGQPKFELFASAPTEFFLRGIDASITFRVDSTGRATALVLHQNGLDQVGPRVP